MSFPVVDYVAKNYKVYNTIIIEALITASILLISLAWNDVVHEIVNGYYPPEEKQNLRDKVRYAIIITLIIGTLQLYLFPYLKQLT